MEVGDMLPVPASYRNFNATYIYVKNSQRRLGMKFDIKRQEDGSALVVRMPDDYAPLAGPQPLPRPGRKGEPCDWGFIHQPVLGQKRWRWPFASMEVGDRFRVLQSCIQRKTLENLCYKAKGHFQLRVDGSSFVVTRVAQPLSGFEALTFGLMEKTLKEMYGVDLADQMWLLLEPGQSKRVDARLKPKFKKTAGQSSVFSVTGNDGFPQRRAVDYEQEGFTITRVADNMTINQWADRRKLLDD
jgi:hypothetical protein